MIYKNYPYLAAGIFGLLVPFVPFPEPVLVYAGFIYFLGGCLFGFIWPNDSWKWGLWITGPMVFFLALSVAFAGYVDNFLKKDLPLLLVAIIAACLGSLIVATTRKRQTKKV